VFAQSVGIYFSRFNDFLILASIRRGKQVRDLQVQNAGSSTKAHESQAFVRQFAANPADLVSYTKVRRQL
jgi:hypothetical protein